MKRVTLLALMAAVILPFAAHAQPKADFSGTWTLDTAKSDPPPQGRGGGGGGGGGTQTIKQTANELSIASEGRGGPQTLVYKLDGSWEDFTPSERSLFTLARKLAASPVVLTDDDVAAALKLTGPREVVQLVSYTTGRALFDRITEAAGLPLEN